jgi:mono/diheme cytochrome c family protein
MPRPRLILRGLAFVACALPVGALVLAACDDAGTLNAGIDSGSSTADATTDATPDATEEASSPDSSETEASCVVDAGPLDDADIYAGFEIVLTHRCKSCHGDGLYGNNDGVPSPTTEGGLAYPPNLTPDPATGLACWTNEQIENAILNGIDNMDMPLCPPMPHFGSPSAGTLQLTPMQVAQVVQYLRS